MSELSGEQRQSDGTTLLFTSKAEEYLLIGVALRSHGWYEWKHIFWSPDVDDISHSDRLEVELITDPDELLEEALWYRKEMRGLVRSNKIPIIWAQSHFEEARQELQAATSDEDMIDLLDGVPNPFIKPRAQFAA